MFREVTPKSSKIRIAPILRNAPFHRATVRSGRLGEPLGCFGEHRQAVIYNRPSLLSQSPPEVLLSLIPERESQVKAILAALCQYDIPGATVYTFHPDEPLLLDRIQTTRQGRSLQAEYGR
jgi:hypothetical protein